MDCIKCGLEIIARKSVKYCSPRCQKLYLKSLYKKRNKEKVLEYNKTYRKLGIHGNPSNTKCLMTFRRNYPYCAKCGSKDNLNVCHIKPRWAGGGNKDNTITLCQKHHHQFDELLRPFWIM
jgi:5-methylcytosine-specific restriction endonuclease McrA